MDKRKDPSVLEKTTEEGPVGSTTRFDPDPLIGSMLERRYLIKRKLGHGAFGAVYLASDEKMMSRPVVVKALLDARISSEWSVRKFKQEMEALARIDHPSVIGIFDSGQLDDGKPFLVMQYVDGASLRALLKPEGMDFSQVANIIRQTGRALNAAHHRGILHRDLKPENIMVQTLNDGEEQVKVIDFGVAKIKNSAISLSTVDDQMVGTVLYMSPEQLKAEPLSPASDVYCFAVIVYEMLTGRRPNNPDSAFQLLEMQRASVRIKPSDLRPSISPIAEAILLKALSFNPKERYQKASEFGDALAAVLLGEVDDPSEVTVVQTPKPAGEAPTLETAHVLFMDIVGYTKLLIDQQTDCLQKLQEVVTATEEFRRPRKERDLIRLPTGDGMALAFFGDPEAPVRCAMQISQAMRQASCGFELRMGIHSGLVYHIADINMNLNVAGGGINVAQRVMDSGDGGHIILSKRVAEDLGQLARWSDYLQDLGEVEVKHGLRVHVFNFYGEDFGNPATPSRLPAPVARPIYKSKAAIAAAALVLLLMVAGGLWLALKQRAATAAPPKSEAPPPIGSEQALTYWLTVQKMRNGKPDGEPIVSAGDNLFGNGWKFRFNLRPAQSGALYLLNLGPGKQGLEEYNILFPIPEREQPLSDKNLNATLAGGQTVQLPRTEWFRFVEKTGVEKIWIIWSAEPVAALDTIFQEAARNKDLPGVITNPEHIAQINTLIKKHEETPPESQTDKASKLTLVKGRGEVLVNLVQLSHEGY